MDRLYWIILGCPLMISWIDSETSWSLSAVKGSIQFKTSTSNPGPIFLLSLYSFTPRSASFFGCWACPCSAFNTSFLTPLHGELAPQVFGVRGGRRNGPAVFVSLNLLELKCFFHWWKPRHWVLFHAPSSSWVSPFVEKIGKSGNSARLTFLQASSAFIREVLGAPDLSLGFGEWRAPTISLPPTGKAHHEHWLSHRLMFSVPNSPHLLVVSKIKCGVRGGWAGRRRNITFGCHRAGTSGVC